MILGLSELRLIQCEWSVRRMAYRGWTGISLSLAVLWCLGGGCDANQQTDKWGAIVDSAKDIKKLKPSTTAVRARGLPDQDIGSLSLITHLVNLDFYGGWKAEPAKLTDKGLHTLAQLNLPELKTLHIGFTDNISDAGLKDIASLAHLTRLGLIGCSKLTDQGLREIVSMPSLEDLDLRASPWVTDRTLEVLAHGKGLRGISLSGCRNYTPAGLDKLKKALPGCWIETSEMNDPLN